MAPERVAHNVAMHLTDAEAKFSGDMTEFWDECVDVYNQMSRDYILSDDQKL